MNETKTDRSLSLEADEFVWDTSIETEVHGFVLPILGQWLPTCRPTTVLDLGCGNGALTARLAGMGMDCTGTDYSTSGIKIASEKHQTIPFFQSTIDQSLPQAHWGRYDYVVAIEVIEHLFLPRKLFERAKEALRPGGSLIVSTPYHGYLKNLALALVGRFDSHWHPLRDYGHVKFFSQANLRELFQEQGFSIDKEARIGRIPSFARSMMLKASLHTA